MRIEWRWLVGLVAAGLLTACGDSGPSGPTGPKVLLICADTLRTDFFLHPDIDDAFTPWLDRGVSYRRAHTVAPWTLPTIASVFTGLYPAQHGAGALPGPVANLAEQTPTALDPEAVTLAEMAAAKGVATGLFSAHPWLKEGFGLDQGFEEKQYRAKDAALIRATVDWLRAPPGGGAAFAYLHLMESHDLHRTAKAELEQLLDEADPETRELLAANTTSRACARPDSARCLRNQVYLLSLLRMRQTLAGLLGDLEARGLLTDTQVVLFSDHGEAFGEHLAEQRQLGPDPRGRDGGGHGQYLYQELLHVPLLVWRPDGASGARDDLVSLVDLFPTLLEWLGIDPPPGELPGEALPRPDAGDAAETAKRRTIFASNIAYGPQSIAALAGAEKAIYWPGPDELHIFDLAADPGERRPLERDELVLEFSTLAGDYLELEQYFDGGAPQLDAQHLKDLQAIGYLQGEDEDE